LEQHFERLKAETGIPFDEMIFFDDSTMNTVEIEKMGVLCAHCPRGLTSRIWENALQEYAKMKVMTSTES
jgi:magnesium-dependent phosphatase 1